MRLKQENNKHLQHLQYWASRNSLEHSSPVIEADVILKDGSTFIIVANTMKQLTSEVRYMQLKDFKTSQTEGIMKREKSDLLMGSDYYFLSSKTRKWKNITKDMP